MSLQQKWIVSREYFQVSNTTELFMILLTIRYKINSEVANTTKLDLTSWYEVANLLETRDMLYNLDWRMVIGNIATYPRYLDQSEKNGTISPRILVANS